MNQFRRILHTLVVSFCAGILSSCSQEQNYSNAHEMYTTSSLNIRKGPGANFEILKTVRPNTALLTTDSISSNGFVMVLNSDSTKLGWVSKKYLQLKPLSQSQLQSLLEQQSTKTLTEEQSAKKSAAQTAEHTLGHNLATIETQEVYLESDMKVKRYNSLITQLSNKYVEDREQIANITYKGHKILRDNGIDENMGVIMEGMNLIFHTDQDSLRYSEFAASYVVLRRKGMTHKESIESLRAFLQLTEIY